MTDSGPLEQLPAAVARWWNGRLDHGLKKIEHCLEQLSDDQCWWRPADDQNSIANLLLHLAGNLRQWVLAGVGGQTDDRNRPQEFAKRDGPSAAGLLSQLRDVVRECRQVIGDMTPEDLLRRRRIQGFEVAAGEAVVEAVAHFIGHTHQIVLLTRLQLGSQYRFEWAPRSPEEGAPQ